MTEKVYIPDGTTEKFYLPKNTPRIYVNNDGTDIGGFFIFGKSPVGDSAGGIVMSDVPFEEHNLFIDVNHKGGYGLEVNNKGRGENKQFFVTQNGKTYKLGIYDQALVLTSDPIEVVWDTAARKNIDVRVTIKITPMAEEHAILIEYEAMPLADALGHDAEIAANIAEQLKLAEKAKAAIAESERLAALPTWKKLFGLKK